MSIAPRIMAVYSSLLLTIVVDCSRAFHYWCVRMNILTRVIQARRVSASMHLHAQCNCKKQHATCTPSCLCIHILHRSSSSPMFWMGRCVMSVMVCNAVGNLHPSSVVVWHASSTSVSIAGPPSTLYLVGRTTAHWWRTLVLSGQGVTSCGINCVHTQFTVQLFN